VLTPLVVTADEKRELLLRFPALASVLFFAQLKRAKLFAAQPAMPALQPATEGMEL
jgi:hypothetical protein